jgi:hypothetical protein
MKILQEPISPNHLNAIFFDGVVAEGQYNRKNYTLETYQSGEVYFMGNIHAGKEVIDLGQKELINDDDIENETIDILVDKFIVLKCNGKIVNKDLLIFDNYNEAIECLKELLRIP